MTGANSGIGFHTALELARHGAQVVLACRSLERGEQAVAGIRNEVSGADVSLRTLDLADLSSVRRFVEEFQTQCDGLDVLVNNAGVMAIPQAQTADGFEAQFGTNHLGHFALTGLLLPQLLGSRDPRVVTVSSFAHVAGRIDFNDPQHERRYSKWLAYGQSKLANLLFSAELARRASTAGTALVSVAAHPGYAATNLQSTGPRLAGHAGQAHAWELVNRVVAQSAARGALPTLYAATAHGAVNGLFYGPSLGMRGSPARSPSTPAAHSRATARRLWELSEELTGVRFTALDSVG